MRHASDPSSVCSFAGTSGRHAPTHECTSPSVKDPPSLSVESIGSASVAGGSASRVCSDMGLIAKETTTQLFGTMRGQTKACSTP